MDDLSPYITTKTAALKAQVLAEYHSYILSW